MQRGWTRMRQLISIYVCLVYFFDSDIKIFVSLFHYKPLYKFYNINFAAILIFKAHTLLLIKTYIAKAWKINVNI